MIRRTEVVKRIAVPIDTSGDPGKRRSFGGCYELTQVSGCKVRFGLRIQTKKVRRFLVVVVPEYSFLKFLLYGDVIAVLGYTTSSSHQNQALVETAEFRNSISDSRHFSIWPRNQTFGMSSYYQPRPRGPRGGSGRGGYQQQQQYHNGAPFRNPMPDPFATYQPPPVPHYTTPTIRFVEPPPVGSAPHYPAAPGTVTTVWDPSHFPAGPPRSPSVIMHPKHPRPEFYNPQPAQKSVTFTADGRFVSSHSTLPLYRNSESDFPPLPSPAVLPYQPAPAAAFANSNFSFTLPNGPVSGLLPVVGPVSHPSLLPMATTSSTQQTIITHQPLPSNGARFQRHGGGRVDSHQQWNDRSLRPQQAQPLQQNTPFTVLPFNGSHPAPPWRPPTNGVPVYDGNANFNRPPEPGRTNYRGGTNWSRAGDVQASGSARTATDIRLFPADRNQVPFSGGYQNQNGGFRNNGFRPDRNFLPPSSAASAPVHFPPNHYSSNEPFQNQLSSGPLPLATATTSPAAGTGGVAAEPNTANFTAEDFIEHRMYREAAFNIIKFGRQNDFPLEVIVFPLLCCGNSALLEKYVAKQPELQMKLMKLVELLHVDNGLNRSIVREFARDYCRPQACGLHFVKLKKIATAWVHAFNIDPLEIGSIYRDKCHGALMYLIKNATFEEISVDAWLENVADLVRPFPDELKAFTLNQLLFRKKDNEIMGRVMRMWQFETWAGKTAQELLKIPAVPPKESETAKKVPKTFHPLGLPRDTVKVVDTLASFHAALADMESQADCTVGVDCEWNSSRTGLEIAELALLQMATRTTCYLLDVFTLKQLADVEEWRHLTAVFQNAGIRKLGFDFSQDLQMLKPFLPGYRGGGPENGIVDLKPMAELFADEFPDVFGNDNSPTDIPEPELRAFGLATLVERLLGAPLSKLERMSNWEGRPMREAQIVYAATDAHCLIEVYDRLAENCYARSIPFPPKWMKVKKDPSDKAEKRKAVAARRDSGGSATPPQSSGNGAALLESLEFTVNGETVVNGFHDEVATGEDEPSPSTRSEEVPQRQLLREKQMSFEKDALPS
ncbi:putative Exonuclease mut-7-like protein [Hypsibius exemplaris]|uniref:Exonuclease mut-7-like protein n=1 Tax=Hypsibius exemplaris TaxID=2072580 RepID=A0A1W0X7Y6_HYPEX|nr:putative Exonuclease mut-7-like protein [Hypsibius exemplaris]